MIRTEEDIAAALIELQRLDPRLEAVLQAAGTVPLRRMRTGLPGLAATIVAQQVSTHSAAAIFERLEREVDLEDPRAVAAASPESYRRAGLSAAKERTIRAIGAALGTGELDLARVAGADSEAAVAELVRLPGIGRWTAECHLLFAHGHPDVFPAGDLALQVAFAHAFALAERPKEKALALAAERWRPHRAVAARLLWSYHHAVFRRDAAPALRESPQSGIG